MIQSMWRHLNQAPNFFAYTVLFEQNLNMRKVDWYQNALRKIYDFIVVKAKQNFFKLYAVSGWAKTHILLVVMRHSLWLRELWPINSFLEKGYSGSKKVDYIGCAHSFFGRSGFTKRNHLAAAFNRTFSGSSPQLLYADDFGYFDEVWERGTEFCFPGWVSAVLPFRINKYFVSPIIDAFVFVRMGKLKPYYWSLFAVILNCSKGKKATRKERPLLTFYKD